MRNPEMNRKKLPISRVLNIPDLLHVSGFIDVTHD